MDNNKTNRGGSRSRGASRGASAQRGSSAASRGTAASRRTGSSRGVSRKASSGGSRSAGRRNSRRTSSGRSPYLWVAIGGVILILLITAVVWGVKHFDAEGTLGETETSAEPETELQKEVVVDGVTITGLSKDAAKQEILKNYPWAMRVTYGEDTYEVADLMAEKVEALLNEIYHGEPKETYTLDTTGLEDGVNGQIEQMQQRWNKAAKNASISGYDAASDSFTFTGEEAGIAIDAEKLRKDMLAAISAKEFDKTIPVTANTVQPEITISKARELYKTIGTYTTKTTSNAKRNTNVRLSCEALNGTIVQPGEELSFNKAVGERTAAKGYQSAAAYNNGAVVQEIGGGVCQTSTTLYNAALKAGMKISKRQSHTFEPSYVTPGMDATVSWGGPDFAFINNSSAAVGIRASYHDQTTTVSIYGIPVLEDGVTYSLDSVKIAELDPPAPTYEEDQTLQLDEEVVKKAGSNGSRWQVKLVIKKNGEVISSEVDHTSTYKGHAAVIQRNTSGVVIPKETDPSETSQSSEASQPQGPGGPETQPEGLENGVGPGGSQTVPETTSAPEIPEDSADGSQPGGGLTPAGSESPGGGSPGGGMQIIPGGPPVA